MNVLVVQNLSGWRVLQPRVESKLFCPIIQCFEHKEHSVVLLKPSQSTSSPSIGESNLMIWIGSSVREGQFLQWFLSWRSLQRTTPSIQCTKLLFGGIIPFKINRPDKGWNNNILWIASTEYHFSMAWKFTCYRAIIFMRDLISSCDA